MCGRYVHRSFTEAIDATDQAARSIVVANKIMKPVGIAINPLYPPDTTEASTPFEGSLLC